MATFYAIRHDTNGKLLVQQHTGVGMRFTPIARDAGDVEYLQHLMTFKTTVEAQAFIDTNLRRITDGDWNGTHPSHLQIVPLEITLGD